MGKNKDFISEIFALMIGGIFMFYLSKTLCQNNSEVCLFSWIFFVIFLIVAYLVLRDIFI